MDYLPKPPLDLPLPEKELPAHATHGRTEKTTPHHTEHGPVKTLLSWRAPGRPFRKRGREYYLSGLLIMLLLEILAFLFGQYALMAVIASLVFLAFSLAFTPPHDFHYKISNQGVTIEDHFSLWEELYDFYFKKRDGVIVLHIRTIAIFPGELTLMLGDMDQEHVKSVLAQFLPYREIVRPTFMEKSGDWLSRNFPLERRTTQAQ